MLRLSNMPKLYRYVGTLVITVLVHQRGCIATVALTLVWFQAYVLAKAIAESA